VSTKSRSQLRALLRDRAEYGGGAAERKLALLRALAGARLPEARDVERLHEALLFLRAYPDDARVLAEVERLLRGFARRPDLRRFRDELADTGIAGTDLYYPFFPATAAWLVERFGRRVTIDWETFDEPAFLERNLALLALYCETPGLDESDFELSEWLRRMKSPRESDGEFVARRWGALRMDEFARERFYEELGLPLKLAWAPGGPSRTLAKAELEPTVFQRSPLVHSRPDVATEVRRPPRSIRAVSPREGRALIALAREAMVTRSRDLDAFMHGDERDVRLVDCGDGLVFVCIGVRPERRLLLEAVYAMLTLKNGVPIGYVLSSALMRSSEIAYNVFDTYRGAEAGRIYGRVLAMARALFDVDTFTIYPYQLGDENDEGLKSGAWWFYQKLGFRARDRGVLRTMRAEEARIRRDREHRSSRATLKRLAKHNVYYELGKKRDDVIGLFPLTEVGLAITRYLAQRFGADRERGSAVCAEEVARLLGARGWRGWPAGERLAFERWSPLVKCLGGVERWPSDDRSALVRVMRSKGGRRESDFVRAFDRHAPLRRALRLLVAS
jgi:hypothetical protein